MHLFRRGRHIRSFLVPAAEAATTSTAPAATTSSGLSGLENQRLDLLRGEFVGRCLDAGKGFRPSIGETEFSGAKCREFRLEIGLVPRLRKAGLHQCSAGGRRGLGQRHESLIDLRHGGDLCGSTVRKIESPTGATTTSTTASSSSSSTTGRRHVASRELGDHGVAKAIIRGLNFGKDSGLLVGQLELGGSKRIDLRLEIAPGLSQGRTIEFRDGGVHGQLLAISTDANFFDSGRLAVNAAATRIATARSGSATTTATAATLGKEI